MASSFTSVWPRKGNKVLLEPAQPSLDEGVGLVRSKQPSNEVKAGLIWNGVGYRVWLVVVAVPHCGVSLSPGFPTNTGTPLASRQGALTVGSTIPKLKCSVRNVC